MTGGTRDEMRVLFVTQDYPPEDNAPAARVSGLAEEWSRLGAEVEVLTGIPCYPEGVVAPGYRNRFSRRHENGVEVTRVPHLTLENRGVLRRILLYVSFMLSAVLFAFRIRRRPDVVVATSPHLFTALAGLALSRLRGAVFVMEVRDLWPEAVVASDVLGDRHWIVKVGRRAADLLYRHADHIVVVTRAFAHELERRGVSRHRITFLPNGADPRPGPQFQDPEARAAIRKALDLEGRFVASYIGTIGRAHRVDVLYEAAELSDEPDIAFVVVGPGAARPDLERRQLARPLPNFRLVDRQPRSVARTYLEASDVSVVLLKDRPAFRGTIPSKIFEAMAMGKPIVLGVRGEARELVESSGAGIGVEPESPDAILAAVRRLRDDRALYDRLSDNGRRAVRDRFDRRQIARRYHALLHGLVKDRPRAHSPGSAARDR